MRRIRQRPVELQSLGPALSGDLVGPLLPPGSHSGFAAGISSCQNAFDPDSNDSLTPIDLMDNLDHICDSKDKNGNTTQEGHDVPGSQWLYTPSPHLLQLPDIMPSKTQKLDFSQDSLQTKKTAWAQSPGGS